MALLIEAARAGRQKMLEKPGRVCARGTFPLDDWRDNTMDIAEAAPELWVDAIDPGVIQVEWSVDGQVVAQAMIVCAPGGGS